MTYEELKEFIILKPSYLKNIKKLSLKVKIPYDTCLKAVHEIKKSYKTSSDISEFEKFLISNNLSLSDVKSVKFWQNFNGEPRFSVNTKNHWYENPGEILEEIKEILAEYSTPQHDPILNSTISSSAAVINLYDAHIDKLVLIDETNPSGSVEQNCRIFEEAFNKLLSQSLVYNPELIIFPIGNDFFNANDARNTTVKGTPQDSNPFWKKSFIQGFITLKNCIDKARKYCKIEVPLVISNHDADKLFFLGQILSVVYSNDEFVKIDTSTASRKYIVYGSNLLGFSHGHNEKNYLNSLPSTIMIENKSIMPLIDYIHHFCGDIHHKETFVTHSSKDLKGCTISFLRCLSDLSKWEYEQGFVGVPKTAESYIFTKEKGLAANLLVYI
jgi:hypothetical protein